MTLGGGPSILVSYGDNYTKYSAVNFIISPEKYKTRILFLAAEISEFFCCVLRRSFSTCSGSFWIGSRIVPSAARPETESGAEAAAAHFSVSSQDIPLHASDKDHRDAKPHIVAGACKRFLIDVALHRYLLVGADLPALEIGIIIFHLETVVLINFPTDRDTTVICIFFRKFSKKVVFFCFHNLFYGRSFLLHHEESPGVPSSS